MAPEKRSKIGPFWVIVIMLLIVLGILVLNRDVFTAKEQPASETEPPSTEWTTAPDGGVDVDLPETPMRVVPEEEADPDSAAADTEQ